MDYPKTLQEFQKRYREEDECRLYLEQIRWPDGFVCYDCGGREFWRMKHGRLLCRGCRTQVSVLAGTIFQDTHVPLQIWLHAIWWITSQKNGVSALGLQRVLGLGSYRTAWSLLHKIRSAMVRPGRDLLSGEVEVDETFVGGPRPGKRGRGAEGKQLVVIGAEKAGKKIGRIRMKRIANASGESLEAFITSTITKGSTLETDMWRGYNGVKSLGYKHERVDGEVVGIEEVVPRVHRVASLLKRWLLGTHHGGWDPKHLDTYLEEFIFRFNRRTSNSRGLLFYRVLENAVRVGPKSYAEITAG